MDITEILGFLISLGAFLFVLIYPIWNERQRRKHPEEYEAAQQRKEKRLKTLLKSIDMKVPDEEESDEIIEVERIAPSSSSKKTHIQPRSQVFRHLQPTFIAPTPEKYDLGPRLQKKSMVYGVTGQDEISRGRLLLEQQHSIQDVMILREIIGPPKSLS